MTTEDRGKPPYPPKDRRFSKPIKELLGIYGDSGVGKSHMALTVAKWHQILGSDATFYVISTDQGYGPILEGDDFYDLENIQVEEVYDLDEAMKAAKKFNTLAQRGDWIFSDRSDHIWSWASDEFAQAQSRAQGSDIENLGDLWKLDMTGDYPISGWEWGPVNARYRAYRNLLLSSRAHIITITDEKPLQAASKSTGKGGEAQESKNTFKHLGVKPTGQKDDISLYHTFIHVTAPDPKVQYVATGKDKWGNREWLGKKMSNGSYQHVKMEDFWEDYFVKVAGWEV